MKKVTLINWHSERPVCAHMEKLGFASLPDERSSAVKELDSFEFAELISELLQNYNVCILRRSHEGDTYYNVGITSYNSFGQR